MDQVYYIYRHIRLDTNEVFYIGKGKANMKGKNEKVFYSRAFGKSKGSRNKWWHRIVAKTDYLIEIVFENVNKNLIIQKETEFIKLYGRRDLGLGTLVNLTNGGDGPNEIQLSQDTRDKMRKNSGMKGKFEGRHHGSKPVWAYRLTGEFYKRFDSRIGASRELGINQADIVAAALGQIQFTKNWIFKNSYQGEFLTNPIKPHSCLTPIQCFDLNGNLLHEFPTATAAAKFFNTNSSVIQNCCRRGDKHKHLYIFKRVKDLKVDF